MRSPVTAHRCAACPALMTMPCARRRGRRSEHGWFIVSDTSWDGYTEVPRQIMQGYRLMADEAADQWDGEPPTHVFVQGGVGGAAAAVSVQMRARFQPAPALIVVEPDRAACLLASAELGQPATVPGNLDTLMAGLACGEPSVLAWQELNHAAAAFMAIPDAGGGGVHAAACRAGHRRRRVGCRRSRRLPAGRRRSCGAETLGLDASSRVLAFNTEGATDPALYERLVGSGPRGRLWRSRDESCRDVSCSQRRLLSQPVVISSRH